MPSYTFNPEFIHKYSAFLNSKEYFDVPEFSKSEYWKFHFRTMNINVEGNTIDISGEAGYYALEPKNKTNKMKKFFHYLTRDPGKVKTIVKSRLGWGDGGIKFIGYAEAFDAVMRHDPVAGVVLNRQCINFKNLLEKPGAVKSTQEMQEKFYAGSKYKMNIHHVLAYYYWNILNGYLDFSNIKNILEIGSGVGNLPALLFHYLKDVKITIIDLPEALSMSIAYIADIFPQARICFPHEFSGRQKEDFDFVFLTPKQINLIPDNSMDLAINIVSFQEMLHRQIAEYFDFIHRVVKKGGYFFTSNRTEKIPVPPGDEHKEVAIPMNRFYEFPWRPSNEKLINEISRLHSAAQQEPVSMRLEKIVK